MSRRYWVDNSDSIWTQEGNPGVWKCVTDAYKTQPGAWGPMEELVFKSPIVATSVVISEIATNKDSQHVLAYNFSSPYRTLEEQKKLKAEVIALGNHPNHFVYR